MNTQKIGVKPVTVMVLLLWIGSNFYSCPAAAASDPNAIPVPARAALSTAITQMNQKAYDRAIETLRAFQSQGDSVAETEADAKGYRHPEVCYTLGTCYLIQNQYKQGVVALEQAVKKNPAHISAWLNLAKVFYELGDYARAGQSYTKAYDNASEKNPEHLYFSAAAFLMAQQYDAGANAFQRLFRDHPEKVQPAWRENFVHALLSANRPRQALPHIRELTDATTGDKQIQWQEILLQQYLQLDMRADARSYALLLTRQAPTRAKWWKALTHVELQDGKNESALIALTLYSYLEALSDSETKLLADLHLQLGIPVKAAPLYEASLKNGFNPRLLQNLMLSLQLAGQPEAALDALKRFAPETREPDLLMLKADLLYGLANYKAAAHAYRQVAGVESKQKGRAWLMAGYAALQVQDVDACRHDFEQAAAFDQHRNAARMAMRQLQKHQLKPSEKSSSL
ncbi:MAG: tetratricopeptide repeat protein [Pseudomonadota bacterium]